MVAITGILHEKVISYQSPNQYTQLILDGITLKITAVNLTAITLDFRATNITPLKERFHLSFNREFPRVTQST